MWKRWENWKKQQREQRALRDFRNEIDENLEIFFVSKQLGQLRDFRLEAGMRVKGAALPDAVTGYLERLENFNNVFVAAREYGRWYAADIDRQDQNNAKKLHDLKESAQEKFLGLEAVIKSAQAALIFPLPSPPRKGEGI